MQDEFWSRSDFWSREFGSDQFDNTFFWVVIVILVIAAICGAGWYYR